MQVSDVLQVIVGGCAMGSIYALMALGYTLTYNSLRVINFAQGDMYMMGAVLGLTYTLSGVPYPLAIVLAGLSSAVMGIVMERLIFRPLRNHASMNLVIATIGVSITIRATAQQIWGSQAMAFPPVFGSAPLRFGSVLIMPSYLWVFAIAMTAIVLLQLFLKKTKTGKAMRATAQNRNAASMMGVPVHRMDSLAAAISAGLGGIGGVLVGPIFFVETEMGALAGLKGFAASVLGGFGSLPGAIIGGLVLGLTENLSATFISSTYRDAFAFLVLIVVLVLKPNGILGGKTEQLKL